MDIKRFNERRAEEERKKAGSANTHEARESHNLMAEIFSARAAEHPRKARAADG